MKKIPSAGIITCAGICAAGCLSCVADATIVILDTVTGGAALTQGSTTN